MFFFNFGLLLQDKCKPFQTVFSLLGFLKKHQEVFRILMGNLVHQNDIHFIMAWHQLRSINSKSFSVRYGLFNNLSMFCKCSIQFFYTSNCTIEYAKGYEANGKLIHKFGLFSNRLFYIIWGFKKQICILNRIIHN